MSNSKKTLEKFDRILKEIQKLNIKASREKLLKKLIRSGLDRD